MITNLETKNCFDIILTWGPVTARSVYSAQDRGGGSGIGGQGENKRRAAGAAEGGAGGQCQEEAKVSPDYSLHESFSWAALVGALGSRSERARAWSTV